MNPANDLLCWASELGTGSWQAWRDACRHLRLEPSLMARNFSDLGHAEFDWVANRFATAAPVLAHLPGSGGAFLVTGARPAGFIKKLDRAAEALGAELYGPVFQADGPDTFLVIVDFDEAAELAEAVDCALMQDPATAIARLLPRLDFDEVAEPAEPDERFPRRLQDPTWGLRRPPDGRRLRGARNAVWWVEEHRRENAYVLDHEARWWRVPIREYGPYLAHPGITSLEYDSVARELRVLEHMPLPPLQARAATLASGRLPRREEFGRPPAGRNAYTYVNVTGALKAMILDSLGATAASVRRVA